MVRKRFCARRSLPHRDARGRGAGQMPQLSSCDARVYAIRRAAKRALWLPADWPGTGTTWPQGSGPPRRPRGFCPAPHPHFGKWRISSRCRGCSHRLILQFGKARWSSAKPTSLMLASYSDKSTKDRAPRSAFRLSSDSTQSENVSACRLGVRSSTRRLRFPRSSAFSRLRRRQGNTITSSPRIPGYATSGASPCLKNQSRSAQCGRTGSFETTGG